MEDSGKYYDAITAKYEALGEEAMGYGIRNLTILMSEDRLERTEEKRLISNASGSTTMIGMSVWAFLYCCYKAVLGFRG